MRAARLRPVRRPASSKAHKPNGPNLLSLPLELKQHVLLFTTAQDTARLRGVCKSLNADIKGSTKYLAKKFSGKGLSRLQQCVDEFTSLEPPKDFDSSMKALHVWTKRRGTFDKRYVEIDSVVKLMVHLFLGSGNRSEAKAAEIGRNIRLWSATALHVVWLCRFSDNGFTEQQDIDDIFGALTNLGALSESDYEKLLERAKQPELQQEDHRLGGREWGFKAQERLSFPKLGRMTPLLQYPCISQDPEFGEIYRQESKALKDFLKGKPSRPLLPATHGNLWLTRYLRLPALPNEVSCYYLNDAWSRKEVTKLLALLDTVATKTNPMRVSPLLRAAILARVELF